MTRLIGVNAIKRDASVKCADESQTITEIVMPQAASSTLAHRLIESLQHAAETTHPEQIHLLETHISQIILTGEIAYKIKKPVNLGFLDFRTLQQRKYYCEEELRLNARLAKALYLGIVTINGTPEKPVINGEGPVIEYAIRMRQFPQSAQLDNRLQQGLLTTENMEALGDMLAAFHQSLPAANHEIEYGDTAHILKNVDDNLTVLAGYFYDDAHNTSKPNGGLSAEQQALARITDWVETQNAALEETFIQRRRDGFTRECHGDLHLKNLIWLDEQPIAFDCLEFDESLRWIDVMCEVGFLVMDLMSHQQNTLAYAFLNQYLQHTGDYAGLTVLPYYISYRAMVRAKVDTLRHQQAGISPQELKVADSELHSYLDLALHISEPRQPMLIITRGMSASGKSTISKPLAAELGAIRIRSDVERKRLYKLQATDSAANDIGTGLYSQAISAQTYDKLLSLTEQVLSAGFHVIVDAVFMHKAQRELFQRLAETKGYRFVILEFTASPDTLRERIVHRETGASDADLPVLEHQLKQWQTLDNEERKHQFVVNTESRAVPQTLANQLRRHHLVTDTPSAP